MKDTLKRMLGMSPSSAPEANNPVEEVNMTTEVTQADADLAQMQALDVAGMRDAIASLTADVAAKDAKIAELSAIVEAAKEFEAAQVKAAAEAKTAARVAALVAVVGTEQAASLQAATASMDDAAFDTVVGAISATRKVESAMPAFKEVGVEGSTDQTKLAAEVTGNATLNYLQTLIKNNDLNH